MSVIGIVLSVIILSVLIIVHEFGHFILAKKNGVMVKEFSVGFGPRIFSIGKGETKLSLKAIPFGGSCTMLGALEDDEDDDDEDNEHIHNKKSTEISDEITDSRSYENKSVWARMSIVLAGPVFNFLLAWVLAVIVIGTIGYDPATVTYVEEGSPMYEAGIREGDVITSFNGTKCDFGRDIYLETFIDPIDSLKPVDITYTRDGISHSVTCTPAEYEYYSLGLTYMANDDKAALEEVVENGAIYKAGIREGDIITEINGNKIKTGEELFNYFEKNEITEDKMEITYIRDEIEFSTTVTPEHKEAYKLGFQYNLENVKTDATGALKYSFAEMRFQITSVFKSLAYLFSGKGSLDMLSGPVGIVQVVGETYDASVGLGFTTTLMNLFGLIILLSANLGVINLLPLPALDGGKFILLIVEAIRRKPLNRRYEGIATVIFAVLLMALAAVVLVNDITKFF